MKKNLIDDSLKQDIVAIVVAAGYSSRMEDFKPLLNIDDKPAIIHLIDTIFETSISEIVVVTGHNAEKIDYALDMYADSKVSKDAKIINITFNEFYDNGMFSSIKAGLSEILKDANVKAGMLFPVDIPLVSKETVAGVIQKYKDNNMPACFCVPRVNGKNGHPLLIPKCFFEEIIDYDGEGGLKAVRNRYDENMIFFETSDEGALLDMDKPSDYLRMVKYYESNR